MSTQPANLVSRRMDAIRPSATLAISSLAAQLRKEGQDIISFGAGEPDLETPEPVRTAAIEAIEQGRGKYTAASGMRDLREALAARLAPRGLQYSWDQVVLSSGGKSALFESMFVLLNQGEEVVFPSPYWSSYVDFVVAAGGVAVPVPTSHEDGFQVDPDRLRAAITDKTRVLLLNSPNNPTGALYSRATLEGIAEVVREKNLAVVTDDIYEELIYTGEPFQNILSVAPDLVDRTVIVSGFSKSHSMTGWRLGYLLGPREVAQAVGKLQSQIAGSPNSISQIGALKGLGSPLDPARLQIFDTRRRLMLGKLREIPDIACPEPLGAFYAFPNLTAYLGRRCEGEIVATDDDLVALLLKKAQVATVPGSIFGAPGHIRLSYACSEDHIQEGVRRIASLLQELE
jgi:aspartate aminotransferase